MHPDDDSKTTLSKWPFILGDALLVASALAIAVLGDWQLTNWQVGSCVMAVALGAGLFVLPYVVEFRVRVTEEAQDREAKIRILARQIENITESVEELKMRLPEEARLQRIEDELAALSVSDTLAETGPVSGTAAAEPAEPVQPTREKPQRENPPVLERAKREPRVRHRPDRPRLLERAIDTKPESSSSAVTRIIGSKLQKEAPATDAGESASEADEPVSDAGGDPAQDEAVPPEGAASGPDAGGGSDPEAAEGAAEGAPEIAAANGGTEEEHEADQPEEASGEMLFAEDTIPAPPPKKRVKKKDTALTASIFIGIGNKPYVRGSGAGLSWERGQEMEFQEIGKWRWVAPANIEEPVELQIYRNDTDPDQVGTYQLEPGEKLEVSPVF
ncbi:MAG: hypothetical protein ACLFU4_09370 [Opitutales bacterium]